VVILYRKNRYYRKTKYNKTKQSKLKYIFRKYYNKLKYNSIKAFSICVIFAIIGMYVVMNVDEYVGSLILTGISIPMLLTSVLATKTAMYKINKIDMYDDMKCWGIRITGICLIGVAYALAMAGAVLVIVNLVGIVIILIALEFCLVGAFAEYRSLRRTGNFVYLR